MANCPECLRWGVGRSPRRFCVGAVCDLSRDSAAIGRTAFQPGIGRWRARHWFGGSCAKSSCFTHARFGATAVQAAIASQSSAIRLFPMVVSGLHLMRTPQTKRRNLILVAHFHRDHTLGRMFSLPAAGPRRTAQSTSSMGSAGGLVGVCLVATTVGYGLAANHLVFALYRRYVAECDNDWLTALAFLFSTARNCRRAWPSVVA